MANGPRYHDVQTDLWQVSITIRMRLLADLDEANDWDEHSQIPKPAGNKVRLCPPQINY
jgi:hypothetical protein